MELDLQTVITNLIDNAIKYGASQSRFAVMISDTGESGSISLKYSGIGIKKEDIQSIFDQFYRSDTLVVRDEAGTGLGLAIIRGIIDKHSGTIDVTSTLGEGSEFIATLPRSGLADSS